MEALSQEQALESYLDGLLWGEETSDVEYGGDLSAKDGESAPTSIGKSNQSAVETTLSKRDVIATNASASVESRDMQSLTPFTVVGLNLALPTGRVMAILAFPDFVLPSARREITLGTAEHDGKRIRIIDSAKLVVPATHPRRDEMIARKKYQFLVLLDDGHTALACDAVREGTVVPDVRIQWRDQTTDHQWLAGTVVDLGYAVVDAGKVIRIAKEQ